MSHSLRIAVAFLTTVSFASLTHAATPVTSQFNVTISVTSKCSFNTPVINDIAYGTQDTAASNLGGTTKFSVVCTKTTPYALTMAPTGSSADGTGTLKGQTSPNVDTIAYALFKDTGHTQPWGTTSNANTVAGTGTGASVEYPVYSLIKTIGNVTPDTYKDTVTVSIVY